jgi:hypothetical protein
MNIDQNQIAHITISEFHDILASIGWIQDWEKDDGENAQSVKLIPENFEPYYVEGYAEPVKPLSAEEHAKMEVIAEKLNNLLIELRKLDTEFHDICDCR